MTPYIENPKDATKKLREPINEFGKVAGCKINLQKPVIFLYTNNVYTNNQGEILRKQSHLQLHQKE